jgi:hypothetical protein
MWGNSAEFPCAFRDTMGDLLVYGLIVFFLCVVVYLFGGMGRPDLHAEYYESLTAALEKRNREKRENETRKS